MSENTPREHPMDSAQKPDIVDVLCDQFWSKHEAEKRARGQVHEKDPDWEALVAEDDSDVDLLDGKHGSAF